MRETSKGASGSSVGGLRIALAGISREIEDTQRLTLAHHLAQRDIDGGIPLGCVGFPDEAQTGRLSVRAHRPLLSVDHASETAACDLRERGESDELEQRRCEIDGRDQRIAGERRQRIARPEQKRNVELGLEERGAVTAVVVIAEGFAVIGDEHEQQIPSALLTALFHPRDEASELAIEVTHGVGVGLQRGNLARRISGLRVFVRLDRVQVGEEGRFGFFVHPFGEGPVQRIGLDGSALAEMASPVGRRERQIEAAVEPRERAAEGIGREGGAPPARLAEALLHEGNALRETIGVALCAYTVGRRQ